MVSSFGMICGLLAGFCYYNYQNPLFAVLGFALMFMWHVFDGADGQLARATQNFSEIGKVIDGVCDYVTFISVYVGLSLALMPLMGNQKSGISQFLPDYVMPYNPVHMNFNAVNMTSGEKAKKMLTYPASMT